MITPENLKVSINTDYTRGGKNYFVNSVFIGNISTSDNREFTINSPFTYQGYIESEQEEYVVNFLKQAFCNWYNSVESKKIVPEPN